MTVPCLVAEIHPLPGLLLALAAVSVIAFFTARLLTRRRRNIWKRLGRRRRLKYDLQPEGPRLSGTINGRSVELAATQQGSDTEAAIAVVHVSVELHDAPPEMTAEGIPGFVGHLAALGQERIELGAPEFDRDVLIRGADESLVRAYWTESRRSAFLDLVRSETGDQVMLRNGRLESELREIVSELETLDGILNSLLRTAEQMDLAD